MSRLYNGLLKFSCNKFQGFSGLHIACSSGFMDIVKILLSRNDVALNALDDVRFVHVESVLIVLGGESTQTERSSPIWNSGQNAVSLDLL